MEKDEKKIYDLLKVTYDAVKEAKKASEEAHRSRPWLKFLAAIGISTLLLKSYSMYNHYKEPKLKEISYYELISSYFINNNILFVNNNHGKLYRKNKFGYQKITEGSLKTKLPVGIYLFYDHKAVDKIKRIEGDIYFKDNLPLYVNNNLLIIILNDGLHSKSLDSLIALYDFLAKEKNVKLEEIYYKKGLKDVINYF